MHERVWGTWRLASLRRFRDGEFDRDTMGADAEGRIIYEKGGYMCAFLMSQAHKKGESAIAWDTFMSYSGRWKLEGDKVTHTLDFSSVPAMIGTDLVRYVEWVDDDTIKLKTAPHTNKAGQATHDELVWHRVV